MNAVLKPDLSKKSKNQIIILFSVHLHLCLRFRRRSTLLHFCSPRADTHGPGAHNTQRITSSGKNLRLACNTLRTRYPAAGLRVRFVIRTFLMAGFDSLYKSIHVA